MTKNYHKGITLVELLVAISILSILGLGLLGLQYIISQNQTLVFKSFLELNDANDIASQFSRDFRLAKLGENGAYAIEKADDNELIFYSDIDFDGTAEKVRYTLSGSTLTKGIIEPTGSPLSYPSGSEIVKDLTDNVRNSTQSAFTYYNEDWPADTLNNPLSSPASPASLKLVKIYLRINTKDSDPGGDFIIEAFTQPRILKENL